MTNQYHHNHVSLDDTADSIETRMSECLSEFGLSKAGRGLFQHLVKITPSKSHNFSFGYLRKVMCKSSCSEVDDDDCLRVINYFTGGQSRLLDTIFTFIDPESDERHTLNALEVKKLLFQGAFYHPDDPDELVDDCKDHILVSYTPSVLTTSLYEQLNAE